MNKSVFRTERIESISSPEQLNDYIKVCKPPVLILIIAILILFIGAFTWASIGTIASVITTVAMVENGDMTIYVKTEDVDSWETLIDKILTVEEKDFVISREMCNPVPIVVNDNIPEYVAYVGELKTNEWVYVIKTKTDLHDGVFPADIEVEEISTLEFVFN